MQLGLSSYFTTPSMYGLELRGDPFFGKKIHFLKPKLYPYVMKPLIVLLKRPLCSFVEKHV